jgi:hypothetical protein
MKHKTAPHYSKMSPRKSLKNNKVASPPTPTPTPTKIKKERKQSSTARARASVGDCAPPDAVEFGLKQNWDQSRIAEEWQSFRDYHLAHGKQPKHIMAAWRNWCRSPFRNSNSHSSQQPPRPGSRKTGRRKLTALRKSKPMLPELMTKDRAVSLTNKMIGSYPSADLADPETYIATMAAVLCRYPLDVGSAPLKRRDVAEIYSGRGRNRRSVSAAMPAPTWRTNGRHARVPSSPSGNGWRRRPAKPSASALPTGSNNCTFVYIR